MPTLPTKPESARIVLDIFKHFGTRPGEVLQQHDFGVIAASDGLRMSDVADGLEYGYEQGWFEDGPNNSIKLTEAGFAAI